MECFLAVLKNSEYERYTMQFYLGLRYSTRRQNTTNIPSWQLFVTAVAYFGFIKGRPQSQGRKSTSEVQTLDPTGTSVPDCGLDSTSKAPVEGLGVFL